MSTNSSKSRPVVRSTRCRWLLGSPPRSTARIPTRRIDEIGIGSGTIDRLKQMGHYVDAVNVARKADKPELYQNERAAMFWRLREALEKGEISLPTTKLLAELSALRYSYTAIPEGRPGHEPWLSSGSGCKGLVARRAAYQTKNSGARNRTVGQSPLPLS